MDEGKKSQVRHLAVLTGQESGRLKAMTSSPIWQILCSSSLSPSRSDTSNVWTLTAQKGCSQFVLKSLKEHCKPKQVFYAVNYIQYSPALSQLHLLSAGLETLN